MALRNHSLSDWKKWITQKPGIGPAVTRGWGEFPDLDAYGKAKRIIFDRFQSDPTLGAFGDAAGLRVQAIVQLRRAVDGCRTHIASPEPDGCQ